MGRLAWIKPSRRSVTNIERPLMKPFNKMQDTAIDFGLENNGSGLFLHPGMGKTRAWLEIINNTRGHVLVMAPKLVCMTTWFDENRKWGYNFSMRFLAGRNKHLHKLPKVCLINYEGIPWLVNQLAAIKDMPFDLVIYDELDKMKNPKSKRFKAWTPYMDRFKYVSGGTGTPVSNHLRDLWAEMRLVDAGQSLGRKYADFEEQFFHKDSYTYAIEPLLDAEADIIELIRPRAISFDINDLDMPELIHTPVELPLPKSTVEYYKELRDESVIEDLEVYAMNAAVRSGKKRQVASGAIYDMHGELKTLHDVKAKQLKKIVDKANGEPVMVFFEYLHDYQAICDMLGPVPALYGKTKERDVPKIVEKWNAGDIPVIALHPRSASHGLNMQYSGSTVVWYTVPWSLGSIIQGNGRVWRQGKVDDVNAYYLLVMDTEDERVYIRSREKQGVHDRVMEGLLRKD